LVLEPPSLWPLGCSPSWRSAPSWSRRHPSTRSVTAAMQPGPGMPTAEASYAISNARARVTEVFAAPGSNPSIPRTAPVANPAPQQTPWIGSKPKKCNTRLLWTAWWLRATVPRSTVPAVLFTWRGLSGSAARAVEALGTPAAGLRPQLAREKGFPSNLLLD
jgi:hypothetical protein